MALPDAYSLMLRISMITLSVAIFACLFRAIIGPRFTDRVLSVNVIGTNVVAMIAVLSVLLDDGSLLDIAALYAMISFLAVVVLSKCYMLTRHVSALNPHRNRDTAEEKKGQ